VYCGAECSCSTPAYTDHFRMPSLHICQETCTRYACAYEEEDTCMLYEEEDTCICVRRLAQGIREPRLNPEP